MSKILCVGLIALFGMNASAARLKDIANIRGVRSNQLIGYGIVVGLNGTGDSKSEFTNKSMERMFDRLGIKVDGKDIASKSVAAVIVTAVLPPFARAPLPPSPHDGRGSDNHWPHDLASPPPPRPAGDLSPECGFSCWR